MTGSRRNFSMQAYWEHLVQDFEPLLRFRGSSQADWQGWREEALPKLLELLGDFPRRVPLNAEVESSVVDGDLIRERVVFDSEDFMSVPCQVLRPVGMQADGSNAGHPLLARPRAVRQGSGGRHPLVARSMRPRSRSTTTTTASRWRAPAS